MKQLVGLLVLAVALLGPRIGHRIVSISTAGVDAVVLLDVSRSMRAQDVPPSRLDRARRIDHVPRRRPVARGNFHRGVFLAGRRASDQ